MNGLGCHSLVAVLILFKLLGDHELLGDILLGLEILEHWEFEEEGQYVRAIPVAVHQSDDLLGHLVVNLEQDAVAGTDCSRSVFMFLV